MKISERVEKVLDLLEKEYPEAGCALNHKSVYELLVCVTLSAQTTDVSVNKISPELFAKYPDAFAMSKAEVGDVEKIIKTIGMYKTKSARIIEQAGILVKEYSGEVPESDERTGWDRPLDALWKARRNSLSSIRVYRRMLFRFPSQHMPARIRCTAFDREPPVRVTLSQA